MPVDWAQYPADWKTLIVPEIRARSGDRCEWVDRLGNRCCAPHGARIHRVRGVLEQFVLCDDGERTLPCRCDVRAIRVVLTVAHTCQDAHCDDRDHLRHWCQLHNLRYAAAQHERNAAATRARKQREALAAAGQLAAF